MTPGTSVIQRLLGYNYESFIGDISQYVILHVDKCVECGILITLVNLFASWGWGVKGGGIIDFFVIRG